MTQKLITEDTGHFKVIHFKKHETAVSCEGDQTFNKSPVVVDRLWSPPPEKERARRNWKEGTRKLSKGPGLSWVDISHKCLLIAEDYWVGERKGCRSGNEVGYGFAFNPPPTSSASRFYVSLCPCLLQRDFRNHLECLLHPRLRLADLLMSSVIARN